MPERLEVISEKNCNIIRKIDNFNQQQLFHQKNQGSLPKKIPFNYKTYRFITDFYQNSELFLIKLLVFRKSPKISDEPIVSLMQQQFSEISKKFPSKILHFLRWHPWLLAKNIPKSRCCPYDCHSNRPWFSETPENINQTTKTVVLYRKLPASKPNALAFATHRLPRSGSQDHRALPAAQTNDNCDFLSVCPAARDVYKWSRGVLADHYR